jgi:hypothetical protein
VSKNGSRNRAIYQDQHARIIIVRPENNLQLEAGYIYADCTSPNQSPLAVERRTIHLRELLRPAVPFWEVVNTIACYRQ